MSSTRRRWISLALLFVAIEVAYVFIVSAGTFDHWPTTLDYYDRLAEGFRSGHLYLLEPPRPELLAQGDPFDPVFAPYWLADASLYHGRYYLYWGPFPALLLAAVKTLFRISVPVGDQFLVFAFLSISGLCGMLILDRMTRRLFAPAPFYLLASGVLAFALGCPGLHLLASSSIYMAAVTGGQAFLLLGLVFATDAVLESEVRAPRAWRLAAAGTAWVLALACRITVAPTVLVLVIATAAWTTARSSPPAPAPASPEARWRPRARGLFWVAAPVVAGVLVLLLYNQLRFDSWLDFGVHRQLTAWKFKFSTRHFAANIYNYLFRRFSWSCAFPFAIVPYGVPIAHAMPRWLVTAGYYTPEPVVGLLVAAPLTWAIPAAIRAGIRAWRARAEFAANRIFVWFAVAFTVMGTVTILVPLGQWLATMRYLEDAAPGFLLLGNLGIWTLSFNARGSDRARRLVAVVSVGLCAATVGIGLLIGYQGYAGHFEQHSPLLATILSQALSFCPRTGH